MLEKLLLYYERLHIKRQSLNLSLTHDKIMDWDLEIIHEDSKTIIFNENGCSLNLLCAKAYIKLEEWAREITDLEDIECNL